MNIKNLIALVSKEKRNKERVKAMQKIALGLGVAATAGVTAGIIISPKLSKAKSEDFKKKALDAVETINDTVEKKAEKVKNFTNHAAQKTSNVIEDGYEKSESVKKDIKNGYDEISKDINKVTENISDEFKPSKWNINRSKTNGKK